MGRFKVMPTIDQQAIKARCRYRVGTGISFPANLVELTQEGARIEGISRQLGPRDRLTISFGGLSAIDAEVQWIERGQAAHLRFINPLYPAVHTFVLARLRGAHFEVRLAKPKPVIRACC
ncbi:MULTISPECIES: hypothetical protein [unclassified Croceicoccus]|uniref:hypothetical protein n=1 Tax=unclassified Croceicoccus TaxID=2629967 RepID=UPI001E4F168E|nr:MULTISPECIES: hypothetical protein [unclassified Croceicoccus]